jgi:hypothetical protein
LGLDDEDDAGGDSKYKDFISVGTLVLQIVQEEDEREGGRKGSDEYYEEGGY